MARPTRDAPRADVPAHSAAGIAALGLTVDSLDEEGDGVATWRKQRVRVPGVIPGEVVNATLVTGRRGVEAQSVVRVRNSPHRVVPRCRHFGPCGGCSWQHIAYPEQLRLKRERLVAALRAVPGIPAGAIGPVIGLDDPWGFRNKVHFVFGSSADGSLALGHYRRGSQDVWAVDVCPVHEPQGQAVAEEMRDRLSAAHIAPAGRSRDGLARHLVVRASTSTNEVMVTLVVTRNARALRAPMASLLRGPDAPGSVHLNVHAEPSSWLFGTNTRKLSGRDRLREDLAGVSFLISPTAFFQTNVQAATRLVELVLQAIPEEPPMRVPDLYAGAGLFALPLARRGHEVLAVEEHAGAVADGEASRAFNRIAARACRFRAGRVEQIVRALPTARGPVAVVLDPPRQGCSPQVLQDVFARLRPLRAAYVSCDPTSLARDLAVISDCGYRIERVQPVDMFPHTAHVESVAQLRRD